MLKVGITGGIACGKSTVCCLFAFLEVPTYNSDIQAQKLMQLHPHVRQSLIVAFGHEVYCTDGSLNKPFLASLVFENAHSRQTINEIVHPAVQKDFKTWAEQQNSKYVLFESALLYSSGSASLMDFSIVVHSPEEERITRLMQRDGISQQLAQQKINAQAPQNELKQKANILIRNSTHDLLMPQVQNVHQWLIEQTIEKPIGRQCL